MIKTSDILSSVKKSVARRLICSKFLSKYNSQITIKPERHSKHCVQVYQLRILFCFYKSNICCWYKYYWQLNNCIAMLNADPSNIQSFQKWKVQLKKNFIHTIRINVSPENISQHSVLCLSFSTFCPLRYFARTVQGSEHFRTFLGSSWYEYDLVSFTKFWLALIYWKLIKFG